MSVKVTVSGADSSSSPVWLMVGLVCGVSLIIILLLLLYRCRQSKYSCFTRSIQSESHSPGSSTNHGVNQNETHVYGSLQHAPPKPTVTLQPSWTQIYRGETVTVRCEIQGGEGAQWTYEWRRDKLNTPPTSSESRTITVTESDSGGYSCRGTRSSSWTEWSDIITLNVKPPPKPTVILQPSKTQLNSGVIYRGETVTVRCEIHGGEGAQWTYEWRRGQSSIRETSSEYRISRATWSDSGGYSCRGRRGSSWTDWSDIITMTILYPPKPTVTLQPSWTQIYSGVIYRGTTVTVRCEIQEGEGAQWTYEWRRGQKNIHETSSVYTISSVTESHGGGYSCRGRRSSTWTEWSYSTPLTVIIPIKPTVTLQPSWTQIYSGETVTVRCEFQGDEGAQWTYEWRRNKLNTPPTSSEYRIIGATESHGGKYSCRGKRSFSRTEWSDALTVLSKPKTELRADRTDVPVGGSVTLTCSVSPSSSSSSSSSSEWKYYWERYDSYYKLVTSPDAVFLSNGQISVSEGGLYRCRGGRGEPVYYTEDSESVRIDTTVSNRSVVTLYPNWSEIYRGETITVRCEIHGGDTEWDYEWETNSIIKPPNQTEYRIRSASSSNSGNYRYVHSAASLTVSPDRVQHFTSDSVSLTCEGNFTEWRVRKFSEDGRLYSDCRRMTGSTCNIYTSKSDTGVYWCESGSGEFSSAVNITVQTAVSGADSSSSPVWLMVGLVCGVSLIIILLLLLYRCRQSKYSCFTRSIQSESHSPGSSTNHGVNQNETHAYGSLQHGTADVYESVTQVTNRNDSCFTRSIQSESHSPGSSTNHGVNLNETHVYGSLQHGTADVYESVTQMKNRNGSDEYDDITSSLIEFKDLRTKNTESVCAF
ncbi:unnamed protein product [Oreochromis niloticus]|nr:unnamed protein product [Mustela putorius furo]